jgi:hypothetical protein
MFEATDTLNRMLSDRFGLHLMDAAGEVGMQQEVERLLWEAGFSDVQVRLAGVVACPDGIMHGMPFMHV